MAKLLHFTGEGHGMMSGVQEYIVLVEDDLTDTECEDHAAPGFTLDKAHSVLISNPDGTLDDEWPCSLPTEDSLVRR